MNHSNHPDFLRMTACACGERGARCAEHGFIPAALPRRKMLALGVAAGLAAAPALVPRAVRAQTTLTPDAALQRLMDGNARYAASNLNSFNEDLEILRAHTAEKQEPFAAVLSCADSRVPAEIIFDLSIGHLFVTRVAGNVASTEIIASLEYGAAVLGTRVIMVLAHQACGAVKAAVGGKAVPGQISALYAPLQAAVEQGHHDYEATAKLNAKFQAQVLSNASPVLAEQIGAGNLKIVAGYYALDTGKVELL